MTQKRICAVVRLMATVLLIIAPGIAWAGTVFSPNNIVVSRSVYVGMPSTVSVPQTLPPGCVATTVNIPLISPPPPLPATTPVKVTCATSIADGTYPTVFNNNTVDGSFGVTSPIYLDQLTATGAFLNSLAIDPTQIDTSFSSKSELALNKSLDGLSITFVGYVGGPGFTTGPNQLDVSNSNTPGVVDPTNPVVSQYYRAVAEVDSSGDLQITDGNAYSGNNGRAAIKANSSSYYMTGNNNNGGLKVLTKSPFTNQLTQTQIGIDLITSTGAEFLVPGQTPPPVPPNITQIGMFSIGDKPGKDTNFRGLTIFNNTLYVTKGSGGNGVNTVYQVGTAGTLPTPENAPGMPPNLLNEPTTILPGFPTTNASTATSFPFGIFFGDAKTLYVCDEGDGTIADASTSLTAGLQKWSLVSGTWQMDYVLQKGLNLGVQYVVPTPSMQVAYPNPATDGCRNLAGRVNTDGTVDLWAITSTVSTSGDQGADPNKLVFISDKLSDTTLPAGEQFAELKTAGYGEVLRGVSFAPGAIAAAPNSSRTCDGVYNGTFHGNLMVSAGQNCVFVGGAIDGDVQLDGGNLSLTNATVSGNVHVQGGGAFSIGPSATIDGNLQIQNLPAGGVGNQVCDSTINGDLQYQNSGTPVEIGSGSSTCLGNTIGGNLDFHNNDAQGMISDNSITGNLQCHNNTPAASGIADSNTVVGQKQGECAGL